MKTVFIMEDNPHKLEDIMDCLRNHFEDIKIDSCAYLNESMGKLRDEHYDYAILDNTVPRFSDSFDIVSDAAESTISILELFDVPTKCIICSSDYVKLEDQYTNHIGTVKYSPISHDWEKLLISYIQ